MADAKDDGIERVYARDRAEWRAWLEAHHLSAKGVWLIYYKQHTGQPTIPYDEAVEEALCFGWIDSRPNTLDSERYMQMFTRRKAKSPWSRLNKQRVERLTEQGLMAPAGLAMVAAAQRDGSWSVYDAIEDLRVPDDLRRALAERPEAERHFEAFSASAKKQLLWWVESAKQPKTRANHIEQVVGAAAENRNPLAYTGARKAATEGS